MKMMMQMMVVIWGENQLNFLHVYDFIFHNYSNVKDGHDLMTFLYLNMFIVFLM